jgi:hypothetical protein
VRHVRGSCSGTFRHVLLLEGRISSVCTQWRRLEAIRGFRRRAQEPYTHFSNAHHPKYASLANKTFFGKLPIICPVSSIHLCLRIRVARWFVFKPKIPIWVNFGGSSNGKSWYNLWPFGLLYGHWKYFMAKYLVYFVVIWYLAPRFGILYQEKSGNPA